MSIDQRIYLNSKLMKQSGDDTSFILDLGNRFTFKRIVLNAFSCDNLFQNFYDNYADFSYSYDIGDGQVDVTVTCDQFLTKDTFITWFNSKAEGIQLQSVVQPNYSQLLSYQTVNGGHQWAPVGAGWLKLGFNNTLGFNRTHTAYRPYDFTQSPCILVQFNNLPNCYTSKYGQMSFQIENNSSFGGRINKVFQNTTSNQQLILNTEHSITQLHITLLNCDMQKILTVDSGNQADIEVIMNLSLYND